MKSKEQAPMPEESIDELDIDASTSVDDFIKELEAKEKDLHITADLTIEIDESDFDADNIPNFVQQALPASKASPAVLAKDVASSGLKTQVLELESEIRALNDKIANLRAERNDIQEKSDRRSKDFGNYKYRMDRERRGSFIDQISNLASQMLPALDNLDRALDAADGIEADRSAEFQLFYDGIVLVNQQIREVLGGMGVQPISTVGELFDPNLHEAVAVEERDDDSANTILDEMLRGYRIGNRVIRHSMVKVATAPPSLKKDEPATASYEAESEVSPENTPEEAPENDSPAPDASTEDGE